MSIPQTLADAVARCAKRHPPRDTSNADATDLERYVHLLENNAACATVSTAEVIEVLDAIHRIVGDGWPKTIRQGTRLIQQDNGIRIGVDTHVHSMDIMLNMLLDYENFYDRNTFWPEAIAFVEDFDRLVAGPEPLGYYNRMKCGLESRRIVIYKDHVIVFLMRVLRVEETYSKMPANASWGRR